MPLVYELKREDVEYAAALAGQKGHLMEDGSWYDPRSDVRWVPGMTVAWRGRRMYIPDGLPYRQEAVVRSIAKADGVVGIDREGNYIEQTAHTTPPYKVYLVVY